MAGFLVEAPLNVEAHLIEIPLSMRTIVPCAYSCDVTGTRPSGEPHTQHPHAMQAASEEWALQLDGRDGSVDLANSLQRPSFSAPARGKSLGLGSARSGMLQQARVRLRTVPVGAYGAAGVWGHGASAASCAVQNTSHRRPGQPVHYVPTAAGTTVDLAELNSGMHLVMSKAGCACRWRPGAKWTAATAAAAAGPKRAVWPQPR